MPLDLCLTRNGRALYPASASDEAEILRLPERRAITASFSVAPPMKLPRWYRAMVQLLCDATGRWPSREVAHRELMIRAGMFESMVVSTNGDARITPMSTADWEIQDWRDYLDRIIPIIIDEFAGETRAEFRNRVDRFLGIKLKEAWENG